MYIYIKINTTIFLSTIFRHDQPKNNTKWFDQYPRRVLIYQQRYLEYIKHIVLISHNNALQ